MNWKKLSLIIGIIGGICVISLPVYTSLHQVKCMLTFDFEQSVARADSTERRHLDEDLLFKEKRLWHLENDHPEGVLPADVVSEIIRLRNQINGLKQKLGYL